jgi:hypothetical protein
MTEEDFMEFGRAAALRATSNHGRIGNLIFTQTQNASEPTLREPEIRTAFQQEADKRGLFHGIEVPTKYPYQFTGLGARRALTDFALLDGASISGIRNVLVEFKQGQPAGVRSELDGTFDYPTITKDLHKLWAEPVRHGRCMFHICQAANERTMRAIKHKYNAVTLDAVNKSSQTIADNQRVIRDGAAPDTWFLLLILVLHQRGDHKGSFLHRATWSGSEWVFLTPERLQPAGVGSAVTDDSSPAAS